MKKTLITLLISFTATQVKAMDVVIFDRNQDFKIQDTKVSFDALTNNSKLENGYFKVCYKREDEAIDLLSDKYSPEAKKRAATAFYHLNKARNKMIELTGLDYIKTMGQRIVRIDITNGFSSSYKFEEVESGESFNNSLNIPASGIKKVDDVKSWDEEIWFRPSKAVKVDNVVHGATNLMLNFNNSMSSAISLGDNLMSTVVREYALTEELNSTSINAHFDQIALTYAITWAVPFVLNKISSPFKAETYLDTASIPEIIYHEYTHLALSDFISVRSDSIVSEGYANYFASAIANNVNIADKVGKLAKNSPPPRPTFQGTYRLAFDLPGQEHNGFIYSLLISIKDEIAGLYADKVEGEKVANQIIFESRKYFKYKMGPTKDLLSALQASAIASDNSKKRLIMMSVQKIGNKYGI